MREHGPRIGLPTMHIVRDVSPAIGRPATTDRIDPSGCERGGDADQRSPTHQRQTVGRHSAEIGAGFRNRVAANWNLLLAIAESAGVPWKRAAWQAATAIERVREGFDARPSGQS
jgi:Protein of unknown function (DUF3631)